MANRIEAQGVMATSLANRLRLLQVDLADLQPQARAEHLGDEIDQALSQIVPADRQAFLTELSAHFPTWDSEVDLRDQSSARSAFDEKELENPAFLVSRLIETTRRLPREQVKVIQSRLAEAGLLAPGKTEWPETAAREARTRLGLAKDAVIDPHRALETLSILAEVVCNLDQLVWTSWRTIAPSAVVQKPASLRSRLGLFVTASTEVPRAEVEHDVTRLRQLIASLVAVLPESWRIAVERVRTFWPDQVQASVGSGGFGAEAKYWRKYVELTRDHDAASLEDEIRQAIATHAEALMNGTTRPG